MTFTNDHVALTRVGDCFVSTVLLPPIAGHYGGPRYETIVLEPGCPTTELRFGDLGGARHSLAAAIAHHAAVAARVNEEAY